jgi:hypothetical protein
MKNTVKTRSIFTIITIMIFALFLSNCRKDNGEKFTIRGKLLNSCDNPEPVGGHQLFLEFSYGINNKYEQIAATTSADGSFEFTYEKKNAMREMTISGRQANGSGTLNYVFGIPIGRNLEVGNIYSESNFYRVITIKSIRVTSKEDTIYYGLNNRGIFTKLITGPFNQNQIIDTLNGRTPHFYDLTNYNAYSPLTNAIGYAYKLNSANTIQYVSENPVIINCVKHTKLEIEIR